MKQYKLSALCPFHKVEVWDTETGLWKVEQKQGLMLFGAQGGVLTNEGLNDGIAEWILNEKPEFKDYIEKVENKKSKN